MIHAVVINITGEFRSSSSLLMNMVYYNSFIRVLRLQMNSSNPMTGSVLDPDRDITLNPHDSDNTK